MLRRHHLIGGITRVGRTVPKPQLRSRFATPVRITGEIRPNFDAVVALRYPQGLRRSKLETFPRNTTIVLSTTRTRPTIQDVSYSESAKMLSWVQLVSTPTVDTPGTCLLLHFDNRRYLFGHMAEGTQRALTQRRVAMVKIEHIFLSGVVGWANVGGLLGMILTLADVMEAQRANRTAVKKDKPNRDGKQSQGPTDAAALDESRPVYLHGSPEVAYMLATARHFVFRKNMPIKPLPVDKDPRLSDLEHIEPDWQDECIKVWYVPLRVSPVAEAASRPTTPKKRSHDEMAGEPEVQGSMGEPLAEESADQKREAAAGAISAIVDNMFSSNWRLDALVPTTLYEVKLPAKIFMRDGQGNIVRYEGPLPGDEPDVPDIPVLVRNPWPASTVPSLPEMKASRQSTCYIVRNQPIRGKFDAKAAKDYGVRPPDFKYLTMGQSVTGKDGMVVTPDMVMGAPNEGHGFVFVDIPDEAYIEPFLHRPEWANEKIMANVAAFYWTLGSGLVEEPRIQSFMKQHATYKHIISSPESSPNMLSLESPAIFTTKLHRIDPERFPIMHFSNEAKGVGDAPSALAGKLGAQMHMTPRLRFGDENLVPFPNPAQEAKAMSKECLELAQLARAKVSEPEFLARLEEDEKDIPGRDTEIIPLGTGSALPSKYRNVSSTLIRVPGVGNYFLDSGENTIGQLRRALGNEGADEVLINLRAMFISHLHADHHLGTASLLKRWHELTKAMTPESTLLIVAPPHISKWLREYSVVEDIGCSRLRFRTGPGSFLLDDDPADAEKTATGLARIDTCPVDHCQGSLAAVLTWPSGLRIAYSGDCRPSNAFVNIGKDATLLIHESTFDDDKKGDAEAKKHSTISEALDVGRRMQARRVLLTHFSQRYAKVSLQGDRIATEGVQPVKDQVVLMAFDQMRVRIRDFRKAEAFLPAIARLLQDEDD